MASVAQHSSAAVEEESLAEPCHEWSIQSVYDWCSWGEQLQSGAYVCRQLQTSVQRIDVAAPLAELAGDLVDLSTLLGRSVASPLVELGGDFVAEVRLWPTFASCTMSRLERQSGLILSSSKTSKLSRLDGSLCADLLEVVEDSSIYPLLVGGLLTKTPSGMIVLASINPAFSLKAVCFFVGTSMLLKCWVVATRSDAGVADDVRPRKDLAMAVTGLCGIVNLGLAFGGLPALVQVCGIPWSALAGYVAHPTLFVHYAADVVLNPLMLLALGESSKMGAGRDSPTVAPSVVVSSIGACFMVGASLSTSPLWCSVYTGANVCCILFQNFDLSSSFPEGHRGRLVADAYIFSQSLYMVPTLLAVTMPSKAAIMFIPMIDLLGKMGVVQLTEKDKALGRQVSDA